MQFDLFPSQKVDDSSRVRDPRWQNRSVTYQAGDERNAPDWRVEEWNRVFDTLPQVTPDAIFQQARARLISMDVVPPHILELTAQWNVESRLPQIGDLLFQRTHFVRFGDFRLVDLLSATRIGEIVDEPTRFVLQYITLQGHPECGVSNYVLHNDGQQVWFSIKPISRPANILTKLANPIITRRFQVFITTQILDYVVTAVTLDLTGG